MGWEIHYVTSRPSDVPGMHEMTNDWLNKYNFTSGPLHLKPEANASTLEYKKRVCMELAKHAGTVIAIGDTEKDIKTYNNMKSSRPEADYKILCRGNCGDSSGYVSFDEWTTAKGILKEWLDEHNNRHL